MPYGLAVLGHSGAGKTSLLKQEAAYNIVLNRPFRTVNLDPSAQQPYFHINIKDLITLEDAMEEFELGPNGALLYCFQFLLANVGWLKGQFSEQFYYLIDLPGQIELYVGSQLVFQIFKALDLQVAVVQLVDSALISKYDDLLALAMSSLATQINLQVPIVHVLSKIDLLQGRRNGLNLREYLQFDIKGLRELALRRPYREAMSAVIGSYNLLSFTPMTKNREDLVHRIAMLVDRANGFSLNSQSQSEAYKAKLQEFEKFGLLEWETTVAQLQDWLQPEEQIE